MFDLVTLLSMRVAIDALIVAAFWAQSRRYPGIGGPGWWAVASFLSILGSGGLWLRSTGSVFWAIVVGTSLIVASAFAVWFGLRSYLGLPVRRWHLFLAWLGVFGAFCALTYGVDTALGRQIVFSATVIAITVGSLVVLPSVSSLLSETSVTLSAEPEGGVPTTVAVFERPPASISACCTV